MAYDGMGKRRKMGGTMRGNTGAKEFNTVRYSDRGERKGEQGTKGAYGRGKGPRIVGTPGPSAA